MASKPIVLPRREGAEEPGAEQRGSMTSPSKQGTWAPSHLSPPVSVQQLPKSPGLRTGLLTSPKYSYPWCVGATFSQ